MSKLFAALADDHRRELVARLHERQPLSLTDLAEGLAITRQAVTKHLDLLVRTGLVTMERRGRERLHSLDARPLREIEEWLAPYAAAWDRRLERLERHLEADGEASTQRAGAGPERTRSRTTRRGRKP
jgi:DNA-binding transcriptional ArsR family regulator